MLYLFDRESPKENKAFFFRTYGVLTPVECQIIMVCAIFLGMKKKYLDGILIKDCKGCGFCCRKAQCAVSVNIYGKVDVCPALIWDEGKRRYWCKACQVAGELGAKYKAELYIGEGCCCGLNSDRKNIPPPANLRAPVNYPREVQVLLKHTAGQLVSSDLLWLIIRGVARELNDPGFEKWAWNFIKEQRPSYVEEFMG